MACKLYRGAHKLPHMSQVLKRDLDAELIDRAAGKEAFAYALTDEQHRERVEGKPGTGLPYRYLVYDPRGGAMSWTAFYTKAELVSFTKAYGLRIKGSTAPGSQFRVAIPKRRKVKQLRCR